MNDDPEFGDAWVYESIVGALPWIDLSDRAAIALQVAAFEAGVLALAWWYGLPAGAVAGTVAVLVAAAGSAAMLDIGSRVRALPAPEPYRRLLFGSSVEVVLGLLAYVGLLTYLFAYDLPRGGGLLTRFVGRALPLPVVYLALLVLWDVCYRIGTGWWAAVAALYRSVRFEFDPDAADGFRRVDRRNAAFAAAQLALVPFVLDHPLLLAALLGHVVAVIVVVAASIGALRSP